VSWEGKAIGWICWLHAAPGWRAPLARLLFPITSRAWEPLFDRMGRKLAVDAHEKADEAARAGWHVHERLWREHAEVAERGFKKEAADGPAT
jgi:hypothetical protein